MLTLLCCCTGVLAQSASDVLSGIFTINASGTTVQFSKGNLQKIGSNYQFAEHQYDYIGNNQTDSNKDLFAFNGYSTPDASWFNMSYDQWKYLLATRSVTNSLYAGARYTMATLGNTYKGLIIFPDNYTHPDGTDFEAGTYNNYSDFTATVSLDGWALMEAAGCVFLPAAGFYSAPRNDFYEFGEAVAINTTTSSGSNDYYTPTFKKDQADCDATSNKNSWIPVRLVQLKTNLQKDADGYYLIGTVQDWKDFAALVEIMPKANAKMTADIDLGNDQTHISGTWKGESSPEHYGGIFDGQGHTLTVNYNDDKYFKAPFGHCYGATIKNLHVAGYIYARSQNPHTAGVMCNSTGNDLVQNVWVSATINTTSDAAGAFIGLNNSGASTIRDCLFTGTITTVNGSGDGCFLGRVRYGSSNIINCLSTGTFNYYGSGSFDGTHTNCYVKQFDGTIPAAMQLTDAQLTDGTIAYKLQAGRTDMVWGQRIGTDPKPLQTNNESYRVYRSKNGGYTNDPTLAYEGLQQDADDNYYLIGSLFDWQEFADLVKTTPTANAKMTADINLGDDQTMIGSESTPYQGLFDGQGHTLTVAYSVTSSSSQHVAPFIKIKNATIQNLHVSGSITTAGMRPASITSYVSGTCYVRNCWSDVAITSSYNTDICAGGLVTRIDASQTLNMDDCKFSGSITLSNNSGYRAGGLIGWTQDKGIAKVTNCLFAPSALSTIKSSADNKMLVSGYQGEVTITNCYYNEVGASASPSWVVQGTAATNAELSNGTTTTALNNDRTGDDAPWVQQGNQPMLAIFPAVTLTDETGLTALSAYAGRTCTVTYSRSFTEAKSSTVCLPFAFAKGSVGTFYTFTGITKNESGEYIATMTEYTGDNLVANTPYLFKPSATSDVDFSGTYTLPASITAGSTESGDWTYLGTYETISWTEAPTGIYGFSAQAVGDIQQGEFVKVGEYVRIKPMRCYLKYKNGSANYTGARGMSRASDEELPETIKVRLIGADGEVTAIGTISTKTGEGTIDNGAWYSLDGRRIEGKPNTKGIYVNNGKKVVIK